MTEWNSQEIKGITLLFIEWFFIGRSKLKSPPKVIKEDSSVDVKIYAGQSSCVLKSALCLCNNETDEKIITNTKTEVITIVLFSRFIFS